jgi:alkylated DNA repair dioxygenase AlkB
MITRMGAIEPGYALVVRSDRERAVPAIGSKKGPKHENKMMIPKVAKILPGADIYFDEHFLDTEDATQLFNLLSCRPEWTRRAFMGRSVPRSEIYMGDPGTKYKYSNRTYEPLSWIPEVAALRRDIQRVTGKQFNSVLMNLYRDGGDSVALHSDAEPEYGSNPVIASVSLGAARLFRLKEIKGDGRWEIILPHGSLLVMAGETQHNWRHEVPKDASCDEPRINLTFRRIVGLSG